MIKLYIARLPELMQIEPLACAERQREIDEALNERVKREKYYAWRLLEYALKDSLGLDAENIRFEKTDNGKWICGECEFSLSHSKDALAAAVSDRAVGVDVERIRVKRAEKMAEYILTEAEREKYYALSETEREEHLILRWCQKEAIFKLLGKDVFKPREINTADFSCFNDSIELCGEKYIFTVASEEEGGDVAFSSVELAK